MAGFTATPRVEGTGIPQFFAMKRCLRFLILACGIAGVFWWLFADTLRRYGVGHVSQPLRISFWGDYRPYLMWKEMLDTFRATYPEIPLKAEYITDRYDEQSPPIAPQRPPSPMALDGVLSADAVCPVHRLPLPPPAVHERLGQVAHGGL